MLLSSARHSVAADGQPSSSRMLRCRMSSGLSYDPPRRGPGSSAPRGVRRIGGCPLRGDAQGHEVTVAPPPWRIGIHQMVLILSRNLIKPPPLPSFNMIITISGTPGSGKSTIAKQLQQLLHAERIYVGGIRRELAREKGMTLEELNVYARTHPETDVDVDKKAAAEAREMERKGKVVLVEGRTQYHFLPESIKIYIKVDPEEGARRIWNDLQQKETQQQRNEGDITSFEQMKKRTRQREEEDALRYKKYYGINHRDEKQYDFVIDTTKMTADEATKKVLLYIKKGKQPL